MQSIDVNTLKMSLNNLNQDMVNLEKQVTDWPKIEETHYKKYNGASTCRRIDNGFIFLNRR